MSAPTAWGGAKAAAAPISVASTWVFMVVSFLYAPGCTWRRWSVSVSSALGRAFCRPGSPNPLAKHMPDAFDPASDRTRTCLLGPRPERIERHHRTADVE